MKLIGRPGRRLEAGTDAAFCLLARGVTEDELISAEAVKSVGDSNKVSAMLLRLSLLSVVTALTGVSAIALTQPTLAQAPANDPPLPPLPKNCRPIPLVGGDGSEVTKTASPPGFRVPLPGVAPSVGVRNNWNTDWFVPSGQIFRTFRVVFMPRENSEYSVNATFKYPDGTTDQFYRERGRAFTANKPLIIEEPARTDLQPFQVNTNIGGLNAIGSRYTVAVAGCS